jgi:peptide/nickel transport system substrate-binding protein
VDVEHNRPEFARQVGRKEIGHIALFDSSPHSTYRVLSDKISKKQQGLWWQGLDDLILDEMIDQAHETSGIKEREFKYAQALRYLNQNPAWLYLFHPILVTACAKSINDIEITHEGLLRFPGAW